MRALLGAIVMSATCLSCAMSSASAGEGVPAREAAAREAVSEGPGAAAPGGAADVKGGEDPQPIPWKTAPVVVELFSSEGCSSCPPADAVLRRLAESQPVAGAEVLALEMHVDYWDDLGWPDPFSSEVYTSRQRAYTSALGDRSMYTPQMVVDGRVGFVGSSESAARRAIERAAGMPKAKVELSRSGAGDALGVVVSEVPEPAPSAHVLLALVEEGLTTDVKRGENAGALLAHGPVVRSLRKIGEIAAGARGKAFEGSEPLALAPGWRPERVRAVVLVQAASSLAILGAAAAKVR